jgi:hypothetical protein
MLLYLLCLEVVSSTHNLGICHVLVQEFTVFLLLILHSIAILTDWQEEWQLMRRQTTSAATEGDWHKRAKLSKTR